MLTTRSLTAWVLLTAVGCASCAAPRGGARDTLHAANVTPVAAQAAPVATPAQPESLAYTIHVFSTTTRSSAAAPPPELAVVAADGRQTGYDAATRRYLTQLSGVSYDSAASAPEDDDAPAPNSPPSPPAIDSRVMELSAHAGESYTLVVTAAEAGTYALHVSLYGGPGNASVDRNLEDLKLGRGEPRRFTIRVGQGTMVMTP